MQQLGGQARMEQIPAAVRPKLASVASSGREDVASGSAGAGKQTTTTVVTVLCGACPSRSSAVNRPHGPASRQATALQVGRSHRQQGQAWPRPPRGVVVGQVRRAAWIFTCCPGARNPSVLLHRAYPASLSGPRARVGRHSEMAALRHDSKMRCRQPRQRRTALTAAGAKLRRRRSAVLSRKRHHVAPSRRRYGAASAALRSAVMRMWQNVGFQMWMFSAVSAQTGDGCPPALQQADLPGTPSACGQQDQRQRARARATQPARAALRSARR